MVRRRVKEYRRRQLSLMESRGEFVGYCGPLSGVGVLVDHLPMRGQPNNTGRLNRMPGTTGTASVCPMQWCGSSASRGSEFSKNGELGPLKTAY